MVGNLLTIQTLAVTGLNQGGLHLDRNGVIKLAGNFIYFINNNNNWSNDDSEIDRNQNNYFNVNAIPFHSVISKMRAFKMGSFNIASCVKHYEELPILMEKQPLDLLCINESRLNETISDGEIKLSGYPSW